MHGTPLFLFPPYQKPPSNGLRQRRNPKKTAHRHRFAQTARCEKPPKSGCRNVIPRPANNLYNRPSAVDSFLHNQPQVGKPTWGYDYTTALRRLPHPSSSISKNVLTHRPPSPKTHSPIGHHPQKRRPPIGLHLQERHPPIGLHLQKRHPPIGHHPQKRRPSSMVCAIGAMQKTAEERFNMLARGWLAYPVTSIHSHLPPKSGCRNVILAKP